MAEYLVDFDAPSRVVSDVEATATEIKVKQQGLVVQEIVRCRDCRWYGRRHHVCFFRPIYTFPVREDHFCALGERLREVAWRIS